MTKAANFTVIFDQGHTTGDGLHGIRFTIPKSCNVHEKAILMFMIDEALSDDSGSMEITINEVVRYKKVLFEDRTYHSTHEVLPEGALRHGENRISFRVKQSDDTYTFVQISDVVLWWHEDV